MKNNAQSPKKILIVDDDIGVREILSYILKSNGFEIITAADGRSALGALYKHRDIDLILLDVHMPVIDGIELLKKIKSDENLKKITVVMMSASQDQEIIDLAKSLGAINFIDKFNIDRFQNKQFWIELIFP